MKKYAIVIVILILGFLTGFNLYRISKIDNNNKEIISEKIEDECTALGELDEYEIENIIQTNNKEKKTSPNCTLTLKVYHIPCNHLIEKKRMLEDTEVNITEDELRKRFSSWEIQEFTPTNIVLYKEVNEFCNQHYMLKNENGYITIYKLNENANEEFYKKTQIPTEYLSQEDLEKINNGLTVYTDKELNKTLEDFE